MLFIIPSTNRSLSCCRNGQPFSSRKLRIMWLTFILGMRWKIIFFILFLAVGECRKSKRNQQKCGGYLTASSGTIQTPNFPGPFKVPIHCRWIISSEYASEHANQASIVVYFTQLYVVNGLVFKESIQADGKQSTHVHTITEETMHEDRFVHVMYPYLIVEFKMDQLEGNQFRALDGLMDVYGFNLTYEISPKKDAVRHNSCTVYSCSLVGHCYASHEVT